LQWLDWSNPLSLVIFSLTIFYVLEVTARLVVLGPERFWNKNAFMNRLDLLNVYGLVIAEAVCASIPGYYEVGSHLVLLLHIARSLRLFRHVKQLRFVAHLTVKLWPTYYRMGMLLLLLFYIFDTIGVQVFGGLIYKGNPALTGSGFASADYWPFNFNDFNSGMVTMFLLMVVNNWFVFTAAFMAVTGTRLAAIFSLSFFIITNLIVLNVLMSLILDLSGSVREEMHAADAEAAEAAAVDSTSISDAPRKGKATDYMHMIRNVLLHHHEDDGNAGGSPRTGLSSGSLISKPSYGAV
jgi:two pore calcium channel protein